MSFFEPKMIMGEKLNCLIDTAYSKDQKILFKSLARQIFDDAINILTAAVRKGTADTIKIDLSVEHVSSLYQFDTSIYNQIGVKREIEKLANDEKLKVYPIEPNKILITF